MNFSELKDAIRVEAGIKDADSYTATLERLINSAFRKYTGLNRYRELRTSFSPTVGAAKQTEFPLPDDFQLMDDLRYNGITIKIFGRTAHPSRRRQTLSLGFPRYAEVVGMNLYLLPGDEITTSDVLKLNYYRFVELVEETDEHPIREMEDVVIASVVARMLFIMDSNKFKVASSIERDSFVKMRAEHAGKS